MEGNSVESSQADLLQELQACFPYLSELWMADGNDADATLCPWPLIGTMLSAGSSREDGGVCFVLPSVERVAFVVAVAAALDRIRRSAEVRELDLLTTPLAAGQLVKVAPGNRVFRVVSGWKEVCGQNWIALENPSDGQIHHLPQGDAVRLTLTSSDRPKPRKGDRPGHGGQTRLDQLLGIRSAGNVASIPNQVILVSSVSDTTSLASGTLVGRQEVSLPADELITWGRIARDGSIVCDGLRAPDLEPIVAVTNSIELARAACARNPNTGRLIISEGARALASNAQAYDELASGQRLLLVAPRYEADHVHELVDRGCRAWMPGDGIVSGRRGRSNGSYFSQLYARSRNTKVLELTQTVVSCGEMETIARALSDAALLRQTDGPEIAESLVARGYWLLLRAAEWIGDPGAAELGQFQASTDGLDTEFEAAAGWLPADFRHHFASVLDGLSLLVKSGGEGTAAKGTALVDLASRDGEAAVIVATPAAAARVSAYLRAKDLDLPVYPIGRANEDLFDHVVLCSWPGRKRTLPFLRRAAAPTVDVICYDYESEWIARFLPLWSRDQQRFSSSPEELTRVTGLSGWAAQPKPEPPLSEPAPAEGELIDAADWLLRMKRKGQPATALDPAEARDAHYLGFTGPGYAYLTEGHKLPVLTGLLAGTSTDVISLKAVRKVGMGDFLLFRAHGDKDVLSLLAERDLGENQYQSLADLASKWRGALKSIGSTPRMIHRVLSLAGLTRSLLTVRLWLEEDGRIGPQSPADLELIARVSGDAELNGQLDDVWAAIRVLRSAHRKAGRTLSALILDYLKGFGEDLDSTGTEVDLGFARGWIVCVEEVDQELSPRPYWEVNRLLGMA